MVRVAACNLAESECNPTAKISAMPYARGAYDKGRADRLLADALERAEEDGL
jgi:hypothetical protein